jgi:hypothetical protein
VRPRLQALRLPPVVLPGRVGLRRRVVGQWPRVVAPPDLGLRRTPRQRFDRISRA